MRDAARHVGKCRAEAQEIGQLLTADTCCRAAGAVGVTIVHVTIVVDDDAGRSPADRQGSHDVSRRVVVRVSRLRGRDHTGTAGRDGDRVAR